MPEKAGNGLAWIRMIKLIIESLFHMLMSALNIGYACNNPERRVFAHCIALKPQWKLQVLLS